MSKIADAPAKRTATVAGARHAEGVRGHLGAQVDRDELNRLPPRSRISRALKWLIPAVVLSAFYYGYREHSGEGMKQMLFAWILPNSMVAALLTALAG